MTTITMPDRDPAPRRIVDVAQALVDTPDLTVVVYDDDRPAGAIRKIRFLDWPTVEVDVAGVVRTLTWDDTLEVVDHRGCCAPDLCPTCNPY
jgi:hypothetical protein